MELIKYKTIMKEEGIVGIVKEKGYEIEHKQLNSPRKIEMVMKEALSIHKETEEYMYEICFDTKLKPLAVFEVSHGTVNATIASPRVFFQKALLVGAVGVVAVHNHPSGCCEPSKQDDETANMLRDAGKLLGIELMDFMIIGNESYSFRECGRL